MPTTVTVFVDLMSRWVAATAVIDGVARDATTFPARVIAGGRLGTQVGIAPALPGPFIVRNGSTGTGPLAACEEDARLALHAIELSAAGERSQAVRLVVLTTDQARADGIASMIVRLAREGVRVEPNAVHYLSTDDERRIAAQAERPNAPGPQCLLRCDHDGSVVLSANGAAAWPHWQPLYGPAERKLMTLHPDLVDPSELLSGEALSDRRIDGAIAGIAKELATKIGPTIKDHLAAFGSTVIIGEDAALMGRVFRAAGERPTLHKNALSAYSIYAARTYLSTARGMDLPLAGGPPAMIVDEQALGGRRRRQSPVRFSDDGREVTLRFKTAHLDATLVQRLRLFSESTKPSDTAEALLREIVKIDRS